MRRNKKMAKKTKKIVKKTKKIRNNRKKKTIITMLNHLIQAKCAIQIARLIRNKKKSNSNNNNSNNQTMKNKKPVSKIMIITTFNEIKYCQQILMNEYQKILKLQD